MNRKAIVIPFLLLISMSLGACGLSTAQTDATIKFADAATQFGNVTSTELGYMRDQTVAMNTAFYRIPDLPTKDRAANSSEEIGVPADIDAEGYKNLAQYFASDWYPVFLSGPVAMSAYGSAITSMLNADNSNQIKQASDNLAAALKAIPDSPVSAASSAAISGLSQQLTEWLLADMKAHAIRAVVDNANMAVDEICSKVGTDFMAKSDAKSLPWRFSETAKLLYASSEQGLKNHKTQPQPRADSLSGFILAQSALDNVNTTFPKIVEASKTCGSANTALVEALHNRSYNIKDIENFFQQAKELYTNVKGLAATQ